jgi:hypothetical protein
VHPICLHGIETDTWIGLKRIRGLDKVSSNKDEFVVVAPFVVERLFAIVEDFGREPKENGVESAEDFTRLLTIFGTPGIGLADTTVEKFVEVFKILASGNTRELDEDRIETYKWSEKKRQAKATSYSSMVR